MKTNIPAKITKYEKLVGVINERYLVLSENTNPKITIIKTAIKKYLIIIQLLQFFK